MQVADADLPVVIKREESGEATVREDQAEIDMKPEDLSREDQKKILDKVFKETVEELNLPCREPIKIKTDEDEEPYPDEERGFGGDEILYAKLKDAADEGLEVIEPGGLDADFIEGCINSQLAYFEELSLRERTSEYAEAVEQQCEGDNLEETLRVKAYVTSDGPDEIRISKESEHLEQGETVPGERDEILATIKKKIYSGGGDTFFDKDFKDKLHEVVKERWQAFALSRSKGRMSNLEPIDCTLKKTAPDSLIVKTRPLGALREDWLRKKVESMVKGGLLKKVTSASYTSQVFVVPKKGPAKYRMVVDMRMLNSITQKTALTLPLLDHQLHLCRESQIFGCFDMKSGYDFLRTTDNAKQYFTLLMPWGEIYEIQGAPQGWVNSPMLFQERMVGEILKPLGIYETAADGALQWIDDCLLYSRTKEGYMSMVRNYLDRLIEKRVRLGVDKCVFFTRQAEFCGRIMQPGEWGYSPVYYQKIRDTKMPYFHYQMAEVIYLATWLSPTIPELVALREVLAKDVQMGMKMRDMKKEKKVLEWTYERKAAWNKFLEIISVAMSRNLKLYDRDKELVVTTDASKKYWAAVVSQCPVADFKNKDFDKQEHYPLMTLSGKFSRSQKNWHISQKELYPMLEVITKLDFLVYGHPRPVKFLTDHRNLAFILKPGATPNKSHVDRLHRWALRFQEADIEVSHLPGEVNLFADMLSRWGNPEASQEENIVRVKRARTRRTSKFSVQDLRVMKSMDEMRVSFLSPVFRGSWEKVTLHEIKKAQAKWKASSSATIELKEDEDGCLRDKENRIFVPEELMDRVLIHYHIASLHATIKDQKRGLIRDYRFEKEGMMDTKLKFIAEKCLHCPRKPALIRRPRDITVLGTKPREILLMDYLYINEDGYLLVLADSFSRKVHLSKVRKPTSGNAVKAILEWRSSVGLIEEFTVFTDRGSHFVSKLLNELGKALRFVHRYAISYAPWTNGGVEVTNSRILRAVRVLVSELSLEMTEWGDLASTIAHYMNNRPTERNLGLTPNEIVMGKGSHRELVLEPEEWTTFRRLSDTLAKPRDARSFLDSLEAFTQQLEAKWSEVYSFVEETRNRANAKYNKGRTVRAVQFMPGDWVMVSRKGTPSERLKYKLRWIGPYKIMETLSPNVYRVKSMHGKVAVIHASRLWFYETSDWKPSDAVRDVFMSDYGELEVEKFEKLRKKAGMYEVLVKWRGFEVEDMSWEPLHVIAQDLPEMLDLFLDDTLKADKRERLRVKKYLNKFTVRLAKIRRDVPRADRWWLPIEDEVLRLCIWKFGIGQYDRIQKESLLQGKTKQQLYNRTQKLVGQQSITEFSGIPLDVREVAAYNEKRWGTRYYVERSRVVSQTEKLARRWFNKKRFGLPKLQREIVIPLFSRKDTPEARRIWLKWLRRAESDKEVLRRLSPPVKDLKKEQGIWLEKCKEDEKFLMLGFARTQLEEFLYRLLCEKRKVSEDVKSLKGVLWEGKECEIVWQEEDTWKLCSGQRSFDVWFPPHRSWILKVDIRELDWMKLVKTFVELHGGLPEVVHMDPPWRVASKDPTRGLALSYPTMKFEEIKNIPLERILKSGYLFIWITPKVRNGVEEWLRACGFRFEGDLYWIKMSKKGRLQSNMGSTLMSAVEVLMIWRKGKVPSSQRILSLGVNVILSERVRNSEKPQEIYQRIEGVFGGTRKLDLFARRANVRRNWTSVGWDLPFSTPEIAEKLGPVE
eukprot:snap_masked-scaffold_10-processed-gene-8.24-mRNA-1 protein AED:0.45 eAED:0.46 QI:0/-1/0/1/-1/1/1/0/1717